VRTDPQQPLQLALRRRRQVEGRRLQRQAGGQAQTGHQMRGAQCFERQATPRRPAAQLTAAPPEVSLRAAQERGNRTGLTTPPLG
jgi:hypothetical protein